MMLKSHSSVDIFVQRFCKDEQNVQTKLGFGTFIDLAADQLDRNMLTKLSTINQIQFRKSEMKFVGDSKWRHQIISLWWYWFKDFLEIACREKLFLQIHGSFVSCLQDDEWIATKLLGLVFQLCFSTVVDQLESPLECTDTKHTLVDCDILMFDESCPALSSVLFQLFNHMRQLESLIQEHSLVKSYFAQYPLAQIFHNAALVRSKVLNECKIKEKICCHKTLHALHVALKEKQNYDAVDDHVETFVDLRESCLVSASDCHASGNYLGAPKIQNLSANSDFGITTCEFKEHSGKQNVLSNAGCQQKNAVTPDLVSSRRSLHRSTETNDYPTQSSLKCSIRNRLAAVGEVYALLVDIMFRVIALFIPLKFKTTLDGHYSPVDHSLFEEERESCLRSFVHDDTEDIKTTAPPTPNANPAKNSLSAGGENNVHREIFRLSTFRNFPPSVSIDARQFAAAGFYHTGRNDEVVCFACSNVLRNLTSRTDPFLLSMHTATCRFARGQDECGNVRLDRFASSSSNSSPSIGYAPRPTAGEVLFGAPPSYQNASARSAPAPHLNSSGAPRVRLASHSTPGSVRHYEGLDMRNYQSARPVAPPPSTYDVPLHRQLATIQNADQARLIRSLNLCRETHRYQTFNSDWPLDSAPSGREMAASGWFYLGNLDRTQCFSCGGVLRNWRRLDNPNTEHISHFPHCTMAQGREIRNIPDTSRQGLAPNRSGLYELTEQQRSDLRNMFPCEFPVTPSMRLIGDRVNSFNNWRFTQATPQMLAEAGFFALGVRDRVKCFYCNGGLQNWTPTDSPWEEHAKWYPTCEFLLQQRGPEYIHTIVARFPNINRPILRAPGQDVPPPALPSPQVQNGSENLQSPQVQRSAESHSTQSRTPEQDPLDVAMQSEVAATVIGMGFEESVVRNVMRANIEEHGVGHQTATSLLDAVVEAQSALEAEEENAEPAMETNPPSTFVLDENMEDEDQFDIYQSAGMDQESIDVPESTLASSSSSIFGADRSFSQSSLHPVDVGTSTPLPSLTQRPIMDADIESSLSVTQPMAPERVASLPVPQAQTAASSSAVDQQERSSSLPETAENDEELKKKLQQKLQQLKDERLCKVCLDRVADMVFIPCGHICCCMECTRALRMCPMCRKKIQRAVRTYTS